MDTKVTIVKSLLEQIGMPKRQQADICALTILGMASIRPADSWKKAQSNWVRIHDVIAFSNKHYNTTYAENSRETFRKQAMHHFRTAALIEDNGMSTNSPNYRYRITDEFLAVIKSIKPNGVVKSKALKDFQKNHLSLTVLYASKKQIKKMPVQINGISFSLSPGKHNELQKAIIEEFAPRFVPNAQCLYLGDTIDKELVKNKSTLEKVGFSITQHDKMPDVVLYCEDRQWLFFVEAVTSVGPMSPARIMELQEMTKDVVAGKIFVTAFLDFNTYKRFSKELAWETEVWIAEAPDHMIHLNGDRFLGPRN